MTSLLTPASLASLPSGEIPATSEQRYLDSLGAQLVKNLPAMQETWVQSLGWEDSPGEGKGYPLQYSGLENSMDCIVHVVTKNWTGTQVSDFHFLSKEDMSDCVPGTWSDRK